MEGTSVDKSADSVAPGQKWPVLVLVCLALAAAAFLLWRRESRPSTIAVYVVGQVKTPGVVVLPRGSRVIQAVQKAGGLTARADAMAINLAAKLQDEEKVVVPARRPTGSPSPARPTPQAAPAAAVHPASATPEAAPRRRSHHRHRHPAARRAVGDDNSQPSARLTPPPPPQPGQGWEGGVVIKQEPSAESPPRPAPVSSGTAHPSR